MKSFSYAFALLAAAVIATGCDKKENPLAGLDNQLKIGDTTFDLVEGHQIWYGAMNYPVNTAEVSLVGDPDVYDADNGLFAPYATIVIEFFVPGSDRKLISGTYNIIPKPEEGEPVSGMREWDCYVRYNVVPSGGLRGEGISGTIRVEVSGEEYKITMKGINTTYGNPVTLVYKAPLEYRDQSTM